MMFLGTNKDNPKYDPKYDGMCALEELNIKAKITN